MALGESRKIDDPIATALAASGAFQRSFRTPPVPGMTSPACLRICDQGQLTLPHLVIG